MVRIRLENLNKRFGDVVAVDNLNLDIRDGEFVALLGPSGCGKTTTLLMIAGIYKPTSGYIYFDDRVMNDVPPKDRNIGMVFQSYALYPHMKVFDNIAFPLKLKKVPRQEIEKRVREVAKILGIDKLLDRKPSQLSGGQQQRVALARAIVKQPDVFLMDEPLSNLDAKLRVMMRAEIKRIQRELGITTIYVTHDQLEAMTMADRIAVLNEGRLQQYAPPEDLYNRPANLFVAGFIGNIPINLIEGYLKRMDGTVLIDAGPLKIGLRDGYAEAIPSHLDMSSVVIGVRPEHIRLGRGSYTGRVVIVEPMGREKIVHLDVDGLNIRALTSSRSRVSEGREIPFDFDLRRIHIFDKATGKAIL